jgi:hypothetical protein
MEAGPGGDLISVYNRILFRPAPLPFDSQPFVIPNHVAEAKGSSGEESHACKVQKYEIVKVKQITI